MSTISVTRLRCEYRENPMGLDTTRPRLSWQIQSPVRNIIQTAYQIQVSEGDDCFDRPIWDSSRVESDQSIHVEYDGIPLKSETRYYFRVKVWDREGKDSEWSQPAFWEMGFLDPKEWKADWIAAEKGEEDANPENCPLLRRAFELKGEVKSARVYTSSLGMYELYLNGHRVGDWLLTPGWTSYQKRLQYQVYDITAELQQGVNVIGAMLGNGWYKGNLAWENSRDLYGDRRALLLQMRIRYTDGCEELIVSDSQWKFTSSPILMSEIYHGETYDARLEEEGWAATDYHDDSWKGVDVIGFPKELLVAQDNEPMRYIEEIKPVTILHTPAGETVIDMGQNMVGHIHFSVEGQPGDEVVLRHAEVLDKEGNFYIDNLRKAKQTIRYILKGNGREYYHPHFTFQGFRYVKVERYPGEIQLDHFKGMVIHTDMDQTGSFECSDELVNQLQHNILWGQKGNFVDVPTDCPQRDERLGWTGDAQMFIRTACFNMSVASFFTKWLKDLQADQLDDGGVPFVIPNVLGERAHSSAAWGDAALIGPWTIYLCYGDKRILEQQYDSMKAWVEYIRRQGENEYLWNTGFHFGDWLALDAKEDSYVGATARDYIATAFYAYSTGILKQTAEILCKEEDIREYCDLYDKIIDNFRREFVTASGRIAVPTQTAHVLALMFDLIDPKDRERTINTLVSYIEESKNHLTTGFVGTPYLNLVLSANGHHDKACQLMMQKDYPSWLYQVLKGATTIWEHWDGIKEDGSFWSADMNSFNHYAYGSIGDWLYRVIAGIDIDPEQPGYKHIVIKPQPGDCFSWARASIQSIHGLVQSGWAKKEDTLEVTVSIPANTTATVILPQADEGLVRESGESLGSSAGLLEKRQMDGQLQLKLGSGQYFFSYPVR